jgi:hypothetical protein
MRASGPVALDGSDVPMHQKDGTTEPLNSVLMN